MLLLLSCWIIAGIRAEDPPMRHHRVKNSSLCLPVGKSPSNHTSWWEFNGRVIVQDRVIKSMYTDKLDYNPKDHTLCIKKLTETESGIYKFSFLSDNVITETHRLIVEETVPRPVIVMSALHPNLSAELCNITVNCSIQDDWVSSVCNEDSCRTSQKSLRKVNITIFTDNKSIVCSGNNNVSTSNASKSTETVCFRKSNPEHEETSEPPTVVVIVIVIVIAVFASLCAFSFCVTKGHFSKEYNHHQAETSTAQIIQSQPVEARPQSVPRVSSSSSTQADAFYENMDATQPCQTSSPTISPRMGLESKQGQKVVSVYSVPNVTFSLDKSEDMKGHKMTQEASTSQCVTLPESEHPAQVDTLYSVLQRPKNLTS